MGIIDCKRFLYLELYMAMLKALCLAEGMLQHRRHAFCGWVIGNAGGLPAWQAGMPARAPPS